MCNKVLKLINHNLTQLEQQCRSMLCDINLTRDFINNHINRKSIPCRNIQQYGHCRYGAQCWFKHNLNNLNNPKRNNSCVNNYKAININNNSKPNQIKSNTHYWKKTPVNNGINKNHKHILSPNLNTNTNCNVSHEDNHKCDQHHNININSTNSFCKNNSLKKYGNMESFEEKEEENYSNISTRNMEKEKDHKKQELFERKNDIMEHIEDKKDIKINTLEDYSNNNIITNIMDNTDNNSEPDNTSNASDTSSISSDSSSENSSININENKDNGIHSEISSKYNEARKLIDDKSYRISLKILNDLIENKKYKNSLKSHPLLGEIFYSSAYLHRLNGRNDLALEILEETYIMNLPDDVQGRIDNMVDQINAAQPDFDEEDCFYQTI